MVIDKEIQFSMSENSHRPSGLHLDNLFTPRQHNFIQRRTGQDDKDVGHYNRQPDP